MVAASTWSSALGEQSPIALAGPVPRGHWSRLVLLMGGRPRCPLRHPSLRCADHVLALCFPCDSVEAGVVVPCVELL